MFDRKIIESTLEKIRSGELSPDQATEFLLGIDRLALEQNEAAIDQTPLESLDGIIERLGVPPVEVVDTWCDQLHRIAATLEATSPEPIPEVRWQDCQLTESGQLRWQGIHSADASDPAAASPSVAACERIESFRESLLGKREPNPNDELTSIPAVAPELAVESAHDLTSQQTSSAPATAPLTKPSRRSHPLARQAMIAAALLGCAGAAYVVISGAMQEEPAPAIAAKENVFSFPNQRAGAQNDRPNPPHSDRSHSLPKTETPEELETLESMTEAELASWEEDSANQPRNFSLDAFMPAATSFAPTPIATSETSNENIDPTNNPSFAPESSTPKSNTTEPTSPDSAAPDAITELPAMSPANDDRAEPPAETQQITDVAESTDAAVLAIELPPSADTNSPKTLQSRKPTKLALDFPIDLPLKLDKTSDNHWQINDTRKNVAVAELASIENDLTIVWTEQSAQSSNVNQLVHGRLMDDAGSRIFLRPLVRAKPYPLRLQSADTMPTWNLRAPIPPRVAHISIDFDLPEGLELGWIEPIESNAIRRTRGLAVVTTDGNEDVSLGVRFDIRCSRKLECRIRYAGRLDSSMPWNVVSNSGLEAFANQLTYQAGLVSTEAQRLSGVYDIAGSMGRRVIKIKQTRNDALAENIRSLSHRVAELQSLIAKVESGGSLRVRVWVDWPDTEQTILTMEE